ncbi:MAG: nuclear transport factor 2 family protein [Bacteroidota bacterium]
MKHLLILSACLIFSHSIQAQDTDLDQVTETLEYYLEGGTNNDFATHKKAFHETATMRYIRDGYQEVNAIDFFKKAIKPGPKQNRTTRIVFVDIAGPAAQARLEIEYETFMFIDYMNLLKIDGEWKVVSKIFHRQPKS